MTVPQEFTRLCNAVLAAEHGDDYLPIDDDAADRGNDGYLKSEKRLFAAHCFKRAQNQSLLRAIRGKMVGDLGKAIALKNEGIWDIEAWTFLTNYPVAEAVAADAVRMGAGAGIDVSWRGADFLATALQRHKEVREQFPQLHVSEISDQLEGLADAVGALAAPLAIPEDGIPRTPDQRRTLARTRPPAWEYLLFAGFLVEGRDQLAMKWHDHELGIARGVSREFDLPDAATYMGDRFGHIGVLVESMMKVFEPAVQEQAFGPPGVPGDPIRIEHTAQRILLTYEGMLDWAAEIRAVDPPDVMRPVFEIAPHMADQPLRQFRAFLDEVERQARRIRNYVTDPNPEKPPLTIELDLVLSTDEVVQKELHKRTKRARRAVRWGW